ncbi:IS110 family transposase [Leisingera sp. HS039]|nr:MULTISPECIES: IS110 family transposase [unclassified Leisingera]MBQ4827557.1 IS110 family transposase [Leisingera sp. HS039]
MDIKVLGIDLGKTVCSLAGLDEAGAVVFRKRLQRHRLLDFLATLPPSVVAMEACCGAHHIGRFCLEKRHEPRLMSPLYVRPYVKVHKNDDRDAEAIAEAATRPTMSSVAIKSEEQLDLQALHRARERLVSDRTRLINQGRGFLMERGIRVGTGRHVFQKELARLSAEGAADLSPRMLLLVTDIPLTLREPCPCCGGVMRIIEIVRRGQKPPSRAPPREQVAWRTARLKRAKLTSCRLQAGSLLACSSPRFAQENAINCSAGIRNPRLQSSERPSAIDTSRPVGGQTPPSQSPAARFSQRQRPGPAASSFRGLSTRADARRRPAVTQRPASKNLQDSCRFKFANCGRPSESERPKGDHCGASWRCNAAGEAAIHPRSSGFGSLSSR